MWKAGWWRGKDRQTEEKDIDNAKLTTEYWLNVAEFWPASLGAASYSSKASISLRKGGISGLRFAESSSFPWADSMAWLLTSASPSSFSSY
ncbi:hypothetical protein MJO29_005434 [Puccinia striiformis f. sp. tritici]|nr:hypothetical protein MJO29_005434 [Puccinia striiformis f. sp. tritici]